MIAALLVLPTRGITFLRRALLSSAVAAGLGLLISSQTTVAQIAEPTATVAPIPASTPGDSPPPAPTEAPVSTSSPTLTITPGQPSTAAIDAYVDARTPQVNVSFDSGTHGNSAAGFNAQTTIRSKASAAALTLNVQGGVCSLITLNPAVGATRSKTSRSAASTAGTSQPIATVTLAYNGAVANQHVWVKPLRGGTLSATDSSGKVYDGNKGFWLTIGANGSVNFSFQAPNVSGTYAVLTRFGNVKTTVPFVVPDIAQ